MEAGENVGFGGIGVDVSEERGGLDGQRTEQAGGDDARIGDEEGAEDVIAWKDLGKVLGDSGVEENVGEIGDGAVHGTRSSSLLGASSLSYLDRTGGTFHDAFIIA